MGIAANQPSARVRAFFWIQALWTGLAGLAAVPFWLATSAFCDHCDSDKVFVLPLAALLIVAKFSIDWLRGRGSKAKLHFNGAYLLIGGAVLGYLLVQDYNPALHGRMPQDPWDVIRPVSWLVLFAVGNLLVAVAVRPKAS